MKKKKNILGNTYLTTITWNQKMFKVFDTVIVWPASIGHNKLTIPMWGIIPGKFELLSYLLSGYRNLHYKTRMVWWPSVL